MKTLITFLFPMLIVSTMALSWAGIEKKPKWNFYIHTTRFEMKWLDLFVPLFLLLYAALSFAGWILLHAGWTMVILFIGSICWMVGVAIYPKPKAQAVQPFLYRELPAPPTPKAVLSARLQCLIEMGFFESKKSRPREWLLEQLLEAIELPIAHDQLSNISRLMLAAATDRVHAIAEADMPGAAGLARQLVLDLANISGEWANEEQVSESWCGPECFSIHIRYRGRMQLIKCPFRNGRLPIAPIIVGINKMIAAQDVQLYAVTEDGHYLVGLQTAEKERIEKKLDIKLFKPSLLEVVE